MEQEYWQSNVFDASVAQDTAWTNYVLQAAPPAGQKLVTKYITVNGGATATTFSLLNGSSGPVLYKFTLPANGWANILQPRGLTAATALCLTSSVASVGAFVGVTGYITKG